MNQSPEILTSSPPEVSISYDFQLVWGDKRTQHRLVVRARLESPSKLTDFLVESCTCHLSRAELYWITNIRNLSFSGQPVCVS